MEAIQVTPSSSSRSVRRSLLRFVLATLALLGLASCIPSDDPDDCREFNHPAETDWYLGTKGKETVFRSASGKSVVLVVTSREVLDGIDSGLCVRQAKYFIEDRPRSLLFSLAFLQDPFSDAPFEEQSLQMIVSGRTTIATGATIRMVSGTFEVSKFTTATNSQPDLSGTLRRYEASRLIGGQTYRDILELTAGPNDEVRRAPAEVRDIAWVRVTFARGFGLVEFEVLSGEVFTRVR